MKKNKLILLILFTIYLNSNILFGNDIADDSLKVKPSKKDSAKCCLLGNKFVDINGDGINDYAPDHDGDGIPNGLDPDYKRKIKADNRPKFYDNKDSTLIKKKLFNKKRFRHRWRR
ncbi:MAG: hypothetical protein V1773_09380 [bacterium]